MTDEEKIAELKSGLEQIWSGKPVGQPITNADLVILHKHIAAETLEKVFGKIE